MEAKSFSRIVERRVRKALRTEREEGEEGLGLTLSDYTDLFSAFLVESHFGLTTQKKKSVYISNTNHCIADDQT